MECTSQLAVPPLIIMQLGGLRTSIMSGSAADDVMQGATAFSGACGSASEFKWLIQKVRLTRYVINLILRSQIKRCTGMVKKEAIGSTKIMGGYGCHCQTILRFPFQLDV